MAHGNTRWSRRFFVGAAAGALALGLATGADAQQASRQPIRIGSTLALTGALAQTSVVHKIVGEIFLEQLNKRGGLLGRPVEWVLLDDQSKPDVARTLYERLITVDKVDLLMGPYATAAILASISVAQRYQKLLIHHTMGVPHLAGTYDMQFTSLIAGAEPNKTFPVILYDAYKNAPNPPKSVAIVTLKFPSTVFYTEGMRDVAKERGLNVVAYLEYDFGTRDFGAIAARIKDANPDLLLMGCLGVEGNLLLEALGKLDYKPKRHFYLFPASGPLAVLPAAQYSTGMTQFEDVAPYTSKPSAAAFAKLFHERAKKENLPYPHVDLQAGTSYSAWEILIAAAEATKSIDDKKMAAWLKNAEVDTVIGKRDFKGKFNTTKEDLESIRQLQDGKFVVVWPPDRATPGKKLIVP
jgi:branched-chain amino acid transport system substrate-binding protein